MFAMQFINAGQTAQSFGLALFFETKHDNLFLFVIGSFVAVMCRDVHVWGYIKDFIKDVNMSQR